MPLDELEVAPRMFCAKCGTQLPDDAAYCVKCGAKTSVNVAQVSSGDKNQSLVIGSPNASSLNAQTAAGSIAPKFGEMIITCEYCGTSITSVARDGLT